MKKIVLMCVALFLVVSVFTLDITKADAQETIKLMMNGQHIELDVAPEIKSGRTYIPIRFIVEQIGADVVWDRDTETVSIFRSGQAIKMSIGHDIISINSLNIKIDAPPYILNGRTMVPLRFISEQFSFNVGWDAQLREVVISQPLDLFLNGHRLRHPFVPVKVMDKIYVPIFEIAKQLNVEVLDLQHTFGFSIEDPELIAHLQHIVKHPESIQSPPVTSVSKNEVNVTISRMGELFLKKREEELRKQQEEAAINQISEQAGENVEAVNKADALNAEALMEEMVESEEEQQDIKEGTQLVDPKETETQRPVISKRRSVKSLPKSEIRVIDGIQMVSEEWVADLLGAQTEIIANKSVNIYKLNELRGIRVEDGFVYLDTSNTSSAVPQFFLNGPQRFVIDLPHTVLADELKPESGGDRIIPVVNHPFIYQIRIAQTSVNPYTVRIVNDLTHTAKATFSKVDHYLRFELSPVKPLVVIDPGHGGRDPGAVGRISNEKTVVLQISKRIADLLEKDERLDVYMTRSQDVFISLDERVAVANQLNADLFLSVHANAMPRSSTVGGTETFIHPSATHHFGQIVHKHLLQATRLTDRGLKTANFRVLRGIDMPAVLIEIAFMSNPQEERLLNDPAFQDRVARAIHNAIIEYLFGK